MPVASFGSGLPLTSPIATEQLARELTLRFGRTTVGVASGNVFSSPSEAIVIPANRRGMMVAGISGLVRLRGGVEIEREVMSRAPLTLGTSIATSSGSLDGEGINLVLHAVVFDDLGGKSRLDHVQRAIGNAIESAERHRVRSVAITPAGSGVGAGRLTPEEVYAAIVEELGSYLRRNVSRIERITILCVSPDDTRTTFSLLQQAYTLWWQLRSSS